MRKILSVLLTVCILLSTVAVFTITISAADPTSGTCGSNLTWKYDTETATLTISGSGKMADYTSDFYNGSSSTAAPWWPYHNSIKTVKIQNGATSIGNYAFYHCESLKNAVIPDSVTTIGGSAFVGCTALTNVTIPDSVTSIGGSAFESCSSFTSVTIPDSVKTIYLSAFVACESLVSVRIGSSVTFIGECAFSFCTSLTTITVSEKNKTYSSQDGALFNKAKTKLIQYPIGNKMTEYIIPDSVTSIGDSAFSQCTSLTSVRIPDSVTGIGVNAFNSCSGLTSLTVPDSVTNVDGWAFSYCTSLKKVTIGISVTSIGDRSFEGCSSLTDVYYPGNESQWKTISIGFFNDCLENANVHFNSYGVDAYIIREVSKYAMGDSIASQLISITSDTSLSSEKMLEKVAEFFSNYGITDCDEGIEYVFDASDKSRSYNMLITDEVYCASGFENFLNNTTKGKVGKGVLAVSGFVFNDDVGDYITGKIPAVENYKTMLLDFMQSSEEDISTVELADKINKFIDNSKDILTAAQQSYFKLEYEKSPNRAQCEKLKKQLFTQVENIIDQGDGKKKIIFKDTDFSKYLGYDIDIVDVACTTIEDVRAFWTLSDRLDTIERYMSFLNIIGNAGDKLPLTLRIAANELIEELDKGWLTPFEDLLVDLFDAEKTLLIEDMLDISLKKEMLSYFVSEAAAESICSTLGAIKLSAWCIEKIAGTGAAVNKAAYTEGYALISHVFKERLISDRQRFISDQSLENAWQFYYDYTMLWNLRYQGETSYLKMNEFPRLVQILTEHNYRLKEVYVDYNLEELEKIRFDLPAEVVVPPAYSCQKKAVVKCPVDVKVYDSDGREIITLYDGDESFVENEYGRFVVTYSPYLEEYVKVLYFAAGDNYRIEVVGTDLGLVEFETAEKVSDDKIRHRTISNLTVCEGSTLVTETNAGTYKFDYDNDGVFEINENITEKKDTTVLPQEINTSFDNICMNTGESTVVNVTVLPVDTSDKTLSWISMDESIASVKNGKITGISSGITKILVIAVGDEDIYSTISVNVMSGVRGDINGDNKVNASDALAIKKIIVGKLEGEQYKTVADLNGDNKVNASDSLILKRIIVGKA